MFWFCKLPTLQSFFQQLFSALKTHCKLEHSAAKEIFFSGVGGDQNIQMNADVALLVQRGGDRAVDTCLWCGRPRFNPPHNDINQCVLEQDL